MRALALAFGIALVLTAAPVVAYADDGDATDATTQADDPGIAHLHDAITQMREARMALRDECADRSDAKCKADVKAAAATAREAFKTARQTAIEEHHAFTQAAKAKRDEAKAKVKESPKPRPSESPRPRPSGSPRRTETPHTPAPSGSPRV